MKIGVVGCMGRMGSTHIKKILETDGLELAGAIDKPEAYITGQDVGELIGMPPIGVEVGDNPTELFEVSEAVIDFTKPEVGINHAEIAAATGTPLVIGTTGFSDTEMKAIKTFAKKIPIVMSFNMSIGVNLMKALVEQAAQRLGLEYDIEITEMHHRHKVDAPSGTAIELGNVIAETRGKKLEDITADPRVGHTGARKEGEIGFAVQRGGEIIGEHTVMFAGPSERIEITHRAYDRGLFSDGAILAAKWLKDRDPGLYSMKDVLDL